MTTTSWPGQIAPRKKRSIDRQGRGSMHVRSRRQKDTRSRASVCVSKSQRAGKRPLACTRLRPMIVRQAESVTAESRPCGSNESCHPVKLTDRLRESHGSLALSACSAKGQGQGFRDWCSQPFEPRRFQLICAQRYSLAAVKPVQAVPYLLPTS